MRELLLSDPTLEAEELDTGWRELNRAQRSALFSLRRDGVISEEVFEELTAEVDARLSEGYPSMPENVEVSTQFLEVTIPSNSLAVGKTVAEIRIPRTAVLVSIKRSGEIIIPRGDSDLLSGDEVTILCESDAAAVVREILISPNPSKMTLEVPSIEAECSMEPQEAVDVEPIE
jgi:hypothetical protein